MSDSATVNQFSSCEGAVIEHKNSEAVALDKHDDSRLSQTPASPNAAVLGDEFYRGLLLNSSWRKLFLTKRLQPIMNMPNTLLKSIRINAAYHRHGNLTALQQIPPGSQLRRMFARLSQFSRSLFHPKFGGPDIAQLQQTSLRIGAVPGRPLPAILEGRKDYGICNCEN